MSVTEILPETKVCRGCEQAKSFAEFDPDRRTLDGLALYCMPCQPNSRSCPTCGVRFRAREADQVFCSVPCVRIGDCRECLTNHCDIHQVPPVCICDEPDLRSDCERCGQGYAFGACHRCHMPVGEQFAEVRAAWREYLEAT